MSTFGTIGAPPALASTGIPGGVAGAATSYAAPAAPVAGTSGQAYAPGAPHGNAAQPTAWSPQPATPQAGYGGQQLAYSAYGQQVTGGGGAPVATPQPPASAQPAAPTGFAPAAAPQAQVATGAALTSPAATAGTSFVAPTANVAAGGVGADIKDAVGSIVGYAQHKYDAVQANVQALMNSEGGELNAARLQFYSTQLSAFENMMQWAAKMEEKRENAIRIWVQR